MLGVAYDRNQNVEENRRPKGPEEGFEKVFSSSCH